MILNLYLYKKKCFFKGVIKNYIIEMGSSFFFPHRHKTLFLTGAEHIVIQDFKLLC